MDRDNHSDDLWDEFERTRPVDSADSEVLAVMPANRDELIGHLGEALRAKLAMPVFLDDDGDYELHHLSQPVWVSVQRRSPSVTIMARVAHGVYSRRSTAVELGILNRDHLHCRWELRDREVWQLAAFPRGAVRARASVPGPRPVLHGHGVDSRRRPGLPYWRKGGLT